MLNNHTPYDTINLFLEDCQFRGLSRSTIRDYRWHLNKMQNQLDDLSKTDRNAIKRLVLMKKESGLSAASVNHYIRVVKAYFTFLYNEGYIHENIMRGLPLVNEPKKLKPVLGPQKIKLLLEAADGEEFHRLRTKSMILLMWDTAIRLNETVSITLSDIDYQRNSLHIVGKGNKDRFVPIGNKSKIAILKYLEIRCTNHSDWLYCTKEGGQVGKRVFHRILERLGKKIDTQVNPHLLRHSAATFLARSGMPAQHLQILLGHSDLGTTQRYINQVLNLEGLRISHRKYSPGDRI